MSKRTGSRFPPPLDINLKLFLGKRLSEYFKYFKYVFNN